MSLSVGIVGFPNVGKSTLFQILTKKQVACANYPFCTINPNIGIVSVFDERIEQISKIINSEKQVYPIIEFIDIAGLIEGSSKGEGLGNKFLANIRETDIIVYVLRIFGNDNIISVRQEINPLKESELLDIELGLKDMEIIEKRIKFLEKEIKSLKKEAVFELKVLKKARGVLEKGELLFEQNFSEEEEKILLLYRFLTMKPRIYLLNGKKEEASQKVIESFKRKNFLIIDFLEEQEFINFNWEEMVPLKLFEESPINELIKKSYDLLGYITFFTANSKEVRAWKIKKGTKAPVAGGIIHSDFEKGFIKAGVINWQDFVRVGGFLEAKKKGLIRTEGKEYFIQDGDVLEIKFK